MEKKEILEKAEKQKTDEYQVMIERNALFAGMIACTLLLAMLTTYYRYFTDRFTIPIFGGSVPMDLVWSLPLEVIWLVYCIYKYVKLRKPLHLIFALVFVFAFIMFALRANGMFGGFSGYLHE